MNPDFFLHHFEPGGEVRAPVLLLLHGTGGTELDLIPLARQLAPAAPVLSPRGRVLENGMPRFFRRLAEGVFDEEDLRRRAAELAEWIPVAAAHHGVAGRPVVAVGFSYGANLAAALLLLHPGVLRGAGLLRALVPLVPATLPPLSATSVLLVSGTADPIVPLANARRLAGLFREAGAEVAHLELPGGHNLGMADVIEARAWLGHVAAGLRT